MVSAAVHWNPQRESSSLLHDVSTETHFLSWQMKREIKIYEHIQWMHTAALLPIRKLQFCSSSAADGAIVV